MKASKTKPLAVGVFAGGVALLVVAVWVCLSCWPWLKRRTWSVACAGDPREAVSGLF